MFLSSRKSVERTHSIDKRQLKNRRSHQKHTQQICSGAVSFECLEFGGECDQLDSNAATSGRNKSITPDLDDQTLFQSQNDNQRTKGIYFRTSHYLPITKNNQFFSLDYFYSQYLMVSHYRFLELYTK